MTKELSKKPGIQDLSKLLTDAEIDMVNGNLKEFQILLEIIEEAHRSKVPKEIMLQVFTQATTEFYDLVETSGPERTKFLMLTKLKKSLAENILNQKPPTIPQEETNGKAND